MTGRQTGDAEFIAASQLRPEIFDEIFRRHFAAVYRFAARQLGASEGEEVAAETFARAFAQRTRFSGRESARGWLFGICVNVVRGQRRSGARQGRAFERAYEPGAAAGDGDDADDALDARLRRDELLIALGCLSAPERDVVVLYALAGLSYSEIAEALALPLGTVRSHLFRARRSLRAALTLPNDPAVQPLTSQGGSHG